MFPLIFEIRKSKGHRECDKLELLFGLVNIYDLQDYSTMASTLGSLIGSDFALVLTSLMLWRTPTAAKPVPKRVNFCVVTEFVKLPTQAIIIERNVHLKCIYRSCSDVGKDCTAYVRIGNNRCNWCDTLAAS